MTPRAGNTFTYGVHRAAASTGLQQNRKSIPAVHCANTYVCVLEDLERGGAQGGTSAQQEAQADGSGKCGTARHQQSRTAQEIHTKSKKMKRKTRRQGVAVCVALRVSASPDRKETREKGRNVCAAPQALVARPHVTAPSARRSSRPLLMRAAGEAHRGRRHERVGGVRVEQLGGKHTAPLAGRVQQQTIKRGKSRKKKVPW
ncbi:hypothetical protein TCSYLVIO_009622 [Trypanosoma cruzi]|nr:hypothetical protein TCSYLVIO_009622 [Trypanosoma cruzi]